MWRSGTDWPNLPDKDSICPSGDLLPGQREKTKLMKSLCFILSFMLLLSLPANGQSKKEKKQIKEQAKLEEFEATKALIESNHFVFKPSWVVSNDSEQLRANRFFLRVTNQEVEAELPYRGHERSYTIPIPANNQDNKNNIIYFKGPAKNYQTEFDEKKKMIYVQFEGNSKKERLSFYFTIYHNGSTTLFLNPSSRTNLKYEGVIEEQ